MQTNKRLTLNTLTSEPRRGDGIPWQPSKKGFNKKKDFEPVINDQLINEFRLSLIHI